MDTGDTNPSTGTDTNLSSDTAVNMENVPSNPSHAIDMSQNIPTANTALLSEPVTPSVNDLNPEESNTIQNNPTSATVTGDIFDNADQSHSTEAEPILSQTSAAFSTDNPINTQTPCKNVAETTVTNASTPAQEVMKKVPENLEAIVKTEQTAETLPAMQENDPTLEEGVDDEAFDDSVETLDSIKVKTELDFQISPASLPSMSHSRTSSLSSKSSKTPSPRSSTSPTGQNQKAKKKRPPPPAKEVGAQDSRNDFYCWVCHKEGEVLCCELCPRVFHAKCLRMRKEPEGDWFCPECEKITEAECKDTQTKAMAQLSIQQLSIHLRYALQRMKVAGSEPFLEPVDTRKFNDYLDYVFHPMDISTLEKNVRRSQYGCTEAFLADVKWILHNCIIYNGTHTKLTHIAKTMVKIAQHEMTEIEVCPECYLNSCRKRENWFCEPCKDPHVLVWAKLQGFPHWPAKALRIDKGMVDARFFGQHDRAWIPLSGCYLMSKEMPHPVKNKKKGRGPGAKGGLDGAMQETQHYIDNVIKKLGTFEYASLRTPLTQMDLCRRQSSTTDRPKGSGTIENKETTADNKSNENVIKHESLDINKSSLATAVKTALGEKLLNFKLSEAEGSNTTDPPKKKSRVVTTSGGHPGGAQKGGQFAPRKRAANASLEKTIESCKASIVDSLQGESDDDFSSEESDSSSEEESTEATSNKSTPTTNKEQVAVKGQEPVQSKAKSATDDSDSELVMDIQEDDHSSKKKDSIAAGLADKGIIKVKKINKDGGKEVKSSKPKSILLNKDAERRTSDPSTTPLRTSVHTGGNMKRKLAEDSPSSLPNVKVRKLDSGSKVYPAKDKKKILSDSSKIAGKSEKDSDNIRIKKSDLTKIRKDVIPGSGGTTKKAINVEVVAKKKLVLTSDATKPKADDGKEKSSLKSTAKILSQKVMNRKLEPSKKTGEKKISESEKSLFGEITPKKLSSFTIPKHKPVASAKSTSDTNVSKPSVSMVAPVQSNQRTSYQPTNHSNHISNTGNVPMQKIQKYNDKVMQGVQQVLVEMYEDMMSVFESNQGKKGTEQPDGTAGQQVAQLRLELERLKWMHQQEIAELQHNHDLTVAEIRQSLENEKRHLLENLKKKHDAEKISAVEETKRKQWCANCGKEAIFYCCWNTSYCDYPCQQRHWPKHMSTCSQASDTAAAAAQAETKTPTSPETKKQTEETKPEPPSLPKEEDTMQVDDHHDDDDDENSDNDMVIDENIDEPTPKKPDIPSPDSPDEEVEEKLKEKIKENSKIDPPSTTAVKSNPIEPVISASPNMVKPLPVRAKSSSPVPGAQSTIVPSKLIDDIFSKVQKKAGMSDIAASSEKLTPTISTSIGPVEISGKNPVLDPETENTPKDVEKTELNEPKTDSMLVQQQDLKICDHEKTTLIKSDPTEEKEAISSKINTDHKVGSANVAESAENVVEPTEKSDVSDLELETTKPSEEVPSTEQPCGEVEGTDKSATDKKPECEDIPDPPTEDDPLTTTQEATSANIETTDFSAANEGDVKTDNIAETTADGPVQPGEKETEDNQITPVFSDNYLKSLQAQRDSAKDSTENSSQSKSEDIKESPDSPEIF